MSELIRGWILLGWFFALIAGQNALILGPFKTQLHCEFEAWQVKQLLHRGYGTTELAGLTFSSCWRGLVADAGDEG